VEEHRDLLFGVDLNLALGRDRRSVGSHHALRKSVGYLWADAIRERLELLDRFVAGIQENPDSLEGDIPSRFWLPMLEQFPFEALILNLNLNLNLTLNLNPQPSTSIST